MIKNVEVGQIISVDVFKPEHGTFPIGRYNGIICKLYLPDNIKYLEYGCTVNAFVGVINERSLSVQVIEVTHSAAENSYAASKAINALKQLAVSGNGKHKSIKL